MGIPKSTLESYIRNGHPLTFEEEGFVIGSGLNDFPGGIPRGSSWKGMPCCGALNSYGVPCIEKPFPDGRCGKHQKIPLAYKYLSMNDRKAIDEVKIGDLQQEIRIFKVLLYKALDSYDITDSASVKNTIALAEQVRVLEAEQYRLTGGTSATNPNELASAMREFCKNASMSIEIRPSEDKPVTPNEQQMVSI